MNEPKKSGNPAVVWGVRVVVFGVLIGLMVVAWMQFSAKRKFEASQDAVVAEYDSKKGAMTLDQAVKLFEGEPEESEGKKDSNFATNIYTWSGPFSEYKLRIRYAVRSKAIQKISGKDDEEDEE